MEQSFCRLDRNYHTCKSRLCCCRFITGSYDRTCKIWDTSSGEELHTLEGHRNVVYAIAFNNPYGLVHVVIIQRLGTFLFCAFKDFPPQKKKRGKVFDMSPFMFRPRIFLLKKDFGYKNYKML